VPHLFHSIIVKRVGYDELHEALLERTASIATLSAGHIAATAAAFGQEDDITVLKIRRQQVPDSAPIQISIPTLSPA